MLRDCDLINEHLYEDKLEFDIEFITINTDISIIELSNKTYKKNQPWPVPFISVLEKMIGVFSN